MLPIPRRAVAALFSLAALTSEIRASDERPAPTLDSFEYVFTKGFFFESTVALTVTKAGKGTYVYTPRQSYPGADASIVRTNWDMPAKDAAALLNGLVEDGLLELETFDSVKHATHHYVHLTSGRWRWRLDAKAMPESIFRRLRPLLVQAHPEEWKAEAKRPPLPDGTRIDSFATGFVPTYGDIHSLSVTRAGKVVYTYHTDPNIGRAGAPSVRKEWDIPAKDAAALLTGLVEDGVLEPADGPGDRKRGLGVSVTYGRWRMDLPSPLPEKSFRRLLPLLQKANPDVWKPATAK